MTLLDDAENATGIPIFASKTAVETYGKGVVRQDFMFFK